MKKDSLTIIFMRHVGKIWSFEIKTDRFIYLLILLACSILASIYFTYGYFSLYRERALLVKEIQRLELDIRNQNSIEIKGVKPVYNPRSAPVSDGPGSPEKSKIATLLSSEISIGDFKVVTAESEPDIINFTFTVYNNTEDNRLVSGYIAMIAQNEDINSPVYGASSMVEVKNGVPVDYRKGQFFAIKHSKPLKGRIKRPKGGAEFKEIVIFVYSIEGDILLNKSFKIKT
ncbi:MAG: hypothetical protein HY739_04540 [Desulfobacterales bacterium]|nr:hypothetical protein [Desulfobacterales bacterium]